MLFACQTISFLHHMGRKSIKHTLVLLGFPLFHLRYLRCLVFLRLSFPVQQQLPVTQASNCKSPVHPPQHQSGAGSVHPSPWQCGASHSTQSTAASIPAIPIDYMGKYKLLSLRVGFPEDSQGHIIRQHAELGSLL